MAEESTTKEENQLAELQEARNQETQEAQVQAPTEKKERESFINGAEAVLLIFVAGFADLLTFLTAAIPGLGSIVSALVWLGFFLWVKFKQLKGAPRYWSRLLMMAGIIELIPLLNILPFWLGFVILLIIADRTGKVPLLGTFIKAAEKI